MRSLLTFIFISERDAATKNCKSVFRYCIIGLVRQTKFFTRTNQVDVYNVFLFLYDSLTMSKNINFAQWYEVYIFMVILCLIPNVLLRSRSIVSTRLQNKKFIRGEKFWFQIWCIYWQSRVKFNSFKHTPGYIRVPSSS